jgi:hypothetical protein
METRHKTVRLRYVHKRDQRRMKMLVGGGEKWKKALSQDDMPW